MKRLIITSLILFILDRITKILVISIGLNNSIVIINNFFNLTYVNNYGAAWSMLTGYRILLILITIIILIGIYFMLLRNKKLDTKEVIMYSLLIGGIVGNLYDRIIYGYVIDFLDFNIFGYNYPIFNLADSFIVISIILIIINEFKGDKSASR